jgi:hypothetical protein
MFRKSRKAGFSCYDITPLPKNCCSTFLFTTGYKRLAEGGHRLFHGGFLAGGKLLKGGLLKGKELLKEKC